MPYTIQTAPEVVKKLPEEAQKIWIAAYNAAYEQYKKDEAKANATAWAALEKSGYKKDGNSWVKAKEIDKIFYLSEIKTKNIALADNGKKTSDIQLLRVGTWQHPMHGKFSITDDDLDEFIENFNDNVRRMELAIDAEHFPEKGAAGWVKKIYKNGSDLIGTIEWTEWGQEAIQKKLFKYVSAEFDFKYKDAETGEKFSNVLFGAALTNRPFIKGQVPVALSENAREDNLYYFTDDENKKGEDMKDFILKLNEVFGLKLSDDAKIDVVEGTLKKLNESVIGSTELKKQVDELTTKLNEATKQLEKSKDGHVSLSEHNKVVAEVKILTDKIALSEAQVSIDAAIVAGKLLPAQQDWATKYALSDKKGFDDFIKIAPVVVKLTENGSANNDNREGITKLNDAVAEKRKENNSLSYAAALKIVLSEKPELGEYSK